MTLSNFKILQCKIVIRNFLFFSSVYLRKACFFGDFKLKIKAEAEGFFSDFL